MENNLKVIILLTTEDTKEVDIKNKLRDSVKELDKKWVSIIDSAERESLLLNPIDIEDNLLITIIKDKTERLLNKKYNVVISLVEPTREQVLFLINTLNYLAQIHISELGFNDTSYLNTVINKNRVESDCIKYFYGKWSTNKVLENAKEDPFLVIFDIDNTLAYSPHRHPYKCTDSEILADKPILACMEVLKLFMSNTNRYKVVFLTGRNERFREVSTKWLIKQLSVFREDINLYMRDERDFRPDYTVKYEKLEKIRKDFEVYNLLCVFDDRKSVVEYFQQKDIYVFDVGQGKNSY